MGAAGCGGRQGCWWQHGWRAAGRAWQALPVSKTLLCPSPTPLLGQRCCWAERRPGLHLMMYCQYCLSRWQVRCTRCTFGESRRLIGRWVDPVPVLGHGLSTATTHSWCVKSLTIPIPSELLLLCWLGQLERLVLLVHPVGFLLLHSLLHQQLVCSGQPPRHLPHLLQPGQELDQLLDLDMSSRQWRQGRPQLLCRLSSRLPVVGGGPMKLCWQPIA